MKASIAWAARVLAALASGSVMASAQQDYMLFCMGCHGPEGRGVPGKVPPLADSLNRFMRTAAGRDYVLRVPGASNSALDDAQLAAVLNWAAATFDSSGKPLAVAPFTADEVSRVRHHTLQQVQATRAAVVKALAASGVAPPASY